MATRTTRSTKSTSKISTKIGKGRRDGKIGTGGELHQIPESLETRLTTNHGVPVSDNQNSLKAGVRGPSLLEDMILREKIQHFDHERIPERIVHARGSAAHGVFTLIKSLKKYTTARILTRRAMCVASPPNSPPVKATGIWSATTSRCSSSRMR
jgi:hypothetical protein